MNNSKSIKQKTRPIQTWICFIALSAILLGQGCSPSHIGTPFGETSTPPHEIKEGTIYFWWLYGEKNELWRLEPDGKSSIVYAIDIELTLKNVASNGLLSNEGVAKIKEYAKDDLNISEWKHGDLPIQIFPSSLNLSPDKKKLAWEETLRYCPPPGSDFPFCTGESAIRIFDLEKNKLQIVPDTQTFSAISYKPLWSQDSRYLAFSGEGGIIKTLDTKTRSVEVVAEGREFHWFPEGHKLAYDAFDGIQMYDLQTKQSAQIPTNIGDFIHLAVSPDGETIVYTINYGRYDLMYMVDLITGKNTPIIEKNDGLWFNNIQWLSNNKIFYTHQESYPDPSYAYVRNVETGDLVLSEEIPLDIMPDDSAQLSTDGAKILFADYTDSNRLALMVFDMVTENWSSIPLPQEILERMSAQPKEYNYYSLWYVTW